MKHSTLVNLNNVLNPNQMHNFGWNQKKIIGKESRVIPGKVKEAKRRILFEEF